MKYLTFLSPSKGPVAMRWALLILLSAAFSALLGAIHLPASLLLGPMIAGILMALANADLKLPRLPYMAAQGIIGCMVAQVISMAIVHTFLQQWPALICVVLLIIGFNCTLGWLLSHYGILPGTTAIWGLLPGAASAMSVMAEAYGADMRLVAFMQYVRVVMVALVASFITHFWVHTTGKAPPLIDWFPPLHGIAFLETLAIIIGGGAIGYVLKIPAGLLLVPLFLGAVLHLTGLVVPELPRWFLAGAYLCVGWQIGLRFTRESLGYALRALPRILLAIFTGILFCGGLSLLLTRFMGIEPLTAYLATSPGGADGVAIIAASVPVDVGFVMALQIVRVLIIIFVGPLFSRFAADKIKTRTAPPA